MPVTEDSPRRGATSPGDRDGAKLESDDGAGTIDRDDAGSAMAVDSDPRPEDGKTGEGGGEEGENEGEEEVQWAPEDMVHYTIDYLIAKRGSVARGNRQFLVKWEGYGEDENSWALEEDICPTMVQEFLEAEKKGIILPRRAADMAAIADRKAAEKKAAEEKAATEKAKKAAAAKRAADAKKDAQAKKEAERARGKRAAEGKKAAERAEKPEKAKRKQARDDGGGGGASATGKAKRQKADKADKAGEPSGPQGRPRLPKPCPINPKWTAGSRRRWWKFNALQADVPTQGSRQAGTDDACTVCFKGGVLLCCENCPRAFHRKCVESVAVENGIPVADVTPPNSADEPWVCINCVELSHTPTCVVSGHQGGDSGHLVPCVSCPRSFHPLVIGDLAAGAAIPGKSPLSCGPDGKWRCSACEDTGVGASSYGTKTPLWPSAEREILRRAAGELSKLPAAHWGSVLGSRVMACAEAEQALADEGGASSGVDGSVNSADEVQRRLFYCRLLRPDFIEGNGPLPIGAADEERVGSAGASPPESPLVALGSTLAKTVRSFLLHGYCAPAEAQYGISASAAETASEFVFKRYTNTMHTISQKDMFDDLIVGFRTFKKRGANRYDMVVDELETMCGLADDDAPWLPVVRAILGDDTRRLAVSCILSLPGSDTQEWHSDGEHLSETMHLPPHCLNVFVPLCDMTPELGPTQFVPGSHVHFDSDADPDSPLRPAGQPILFDHRVRHRGVPNTSKSPRAMLYITYAKSWFVEVNNVGLRDKAKDNYKDLPELIEAPPARAAPEEAASPSPAPEVGLEASEPLEALIDADLAEPFEVVPAVEPHGTAVVGDMSPEW